MKRLIILIFPLLLTGCAGERKFPEVKKLSEYKETDFVITPQSPLPKNKNAVYSATLLLAWDQVRAISENQLTIDKDQPELTLINNSQSYKNTLEKDEYTATTDFNIEQGGLNIFTEFSKSLPFAIKLKDHKKELKFKGESVSTFGANEAECRQDIHLHNVIDIWYYNNDNDFVVMLRPKDTDHLLVLYMPHEKSDNLQEIFDTLNEKMEKAQEEKASGINSWKYDFGMEGDELLIPKFSFNIETDYKQLEGDGFVLQQQPYFIERATQRTAFILDEQGAEVESEAEMIVLEGMPLAVVEEKPHPKKLYFNKPFLVMLKRVDSKNPYFAMWVENTELMQK